MRARWQAAMLLLAIGCCIFTSGCSRSVNGSEKIRAAKTDGNLEPEPASRLSGRVSTPEGKPVVSARVAWIAKGEQSGGIELASTRTDEQGRFLFENSGALRAKGTWPSLLIEAPGWGMTPAMVPEAATQMDVTLRPATEVSVLAVDASGKPVTGVLLNPYFLMAPNMEFYFRFPQDMKTRLGRRTDAHGLCRFEFFPPGVKLRLEVADDRFAHLDFSEDLSLGQSTGNSRHQITLLPAASIQGRITYGPTGKPAAGIRIGAQGVGPSALGGEGVSTDQGEYLIKQMRPGIYNLTPDLRGEVEKSWTACAHEKIPVSQAEQVKGVDFQLIKGGVITGKVTAADNGDPVVGLSLCVYGPAHPRSSGGVQRSDSGKDGGYFLRVPPGEHFLYIGGRPPGRFLENAWSSRDVTVKDGETVTINIALPRRAETKPVLGRVIGWDGKPVPEAHIEALPDDNHGEFGVQMTQKSDKDGRFQIDMNEQPGPVKLRARLGNNTTTLNVRVESGDEVTLQLQTNALCSLSGRVLDANEKPIFDAPIQLTEFSLGQGIGRVVTTTDREGRFQIGSLWPDCGYAVSATAKGYGRNESRIMQLEPGHTRELVDFILKRATKSLAGKVVNEKGEVLMGLTVWMDSEESAHQNVTTDREGLFRFDQVVEGEVRLSVTGLVGQGANGTFQAGETNLVIKVETEVKPTAR